MQRFKKTVFLTVTPLVLFMGYRGYRRMKAMNEQGAKEIEELRFHNIIPDHIRFD